MKKNILVLILAIGLLPSQTSAISSTPFDANTIVQNEQFRTELIQDAAGRKDSINLNIKNFNESQSQKIFEHITNIIFYQSNMDIYSVTMDGTVIGKNANLVLDLDYRMTPEENKQVDEWISKTMTPFLTLKPTNLEIVKFVNDTIVKHVEYDTSYVKNSAYHAVFNKSSLCEGYAFLTHKMLTFANIESKIISGVAANEDHMWNLVKYEDTWYHLDVTWNDPVYLGNYSKPLTYVSHDFFMLTNEQISKTHTWKTELFPYTKNNN